MSYQELVEENARQLAIIESQEAKIAKQQKQYASLQTQFDQLIKLLQGFKSEKFLRTPETPNQPTLFEVESQPEQARPQEETITYKRTKKKHPGRHELPKHLPVREVIIQPEEEVEGLVKIGEEISDTLEYTPASLVIRRTIRPKYAQAENNGVIIGKLPTRPIDKAIAEASLLAYILVSKYVDHLPLYRQIQRFNREFGWNPTQSTLCGWVDSSCQLLEPLYNKLKQKILESDYIQADESPLRVLDKDKPKDSHQGYQWVYHAPLLQLVLFNYRKGRGIHGPKEILQDYRGYLQCDGYKVYDKIAQQEGITAVGCLVHARRKFFDAQDNDAKRAKHALNLFGKIYQLDKEINSEAKENLELKQELRQSKILPIIKEIKTWIQQESLKVSAKSAIGKAMAYYLNQYPKLEATMLDARLKLDNNLIENSIRPLALGRKNYLFAGSHHAAQNTAMMYSFFGSCKMNDVNPLEWLTDVLQKIPDWNIQKLDQLLPNQWKKNNM
jgi:transposase